MSDVLSSPLRVGSATIRNRVYRAPVLEGAGSGPDAADTFTKAFVPNARHGVGLIIQGSACVYEEGRTSPGMTLVHTRELMLAMAEMVREVHDAGAAIFLQIGHGGIYAMEGWHEPYASERKGPLLAASPLPLTLRPSFRGVPVHVMSTDEVHALCRRNGEAAGWAREAGYDGIQLGSANACSTSSSRRSTTAAPTSSAAHPRSAPTSCGSSGSTSPTTPGPTSRAR